MNPGLHWYVAVEPNNVLLRKTSPFSGSSRLPHFTAVTYRWEPNIKLYNTHGKGIPTATYACRMVTSQTTLHWPGRFLSVPPLVWSQYYNCRLQLIQILFHWGPLDHPEGLAVCHSPQLHMKNIHVNCMKSTVISNHAMLLVWYLRWQVAALPDHSPLAWQVLVCSPTSMNPVLQL